MSRRLTGQLVIASIAGLMAWFSLISWNDLIERPDRFLQPAFGGAVLIALVGSVGRWKLRHWYLVFPLQLLVLVVWLQHRLSGRAGLGAWVPTPDGLRRAAEVIANGADEVNTYSSPVALAHTDAAAYLLTAGLLVILAADLLGCGLRRAAWAGLPVVVALTVPISVLDQGLSWFVFAVTALLFVMLLATEEVDRVRAWAQLPDRNRGDSLGRVDGSGAVRTAAMRIGLVTAAGALVLPALVPVGSGLFGRGDGSGSGRGNNDPVRLVNPLIDLHRDLVRRDHLPLLEASTDDTDLGYLRMTVLDEFDGRRWRPSERDLPAANSADGPLPLPPGVPIGSSGPQAEWRLTLTPEFHTAWLPTPYPLRALTPSAGDWRFDGRTMDFANVDDDTPVGIDYALTTFHPPVDASALDRAQPAALSLRRSMTRLPKDMPSTVQDIAESVTAAGTTPYQKMVLLQDWFRRTGGFTYSLDQDTSSSTDELVSFITDDRVGYCEQFAAAMAVMARTLGIPARVVVGFLGPDTISPGNYLYTSDDLHAWPEIYFAGSGWVRFEPTPGTRTGRAPEWTRAQATTERPTSTPSPTASSTDRLPTRDTTTNDPQVTTGSGTDAGDRAAWSVALLILLLLSITPAAARRRQRHLRLKPHRDLSADAIASGLWTELLATADDLRISLPEGRSARQTARVVTERVPAPGSAILELNRLVEFFEEAHYGPAFEVDRSSLPELAALVSGWCERMASSVPRGRRYVAVVLPRSILTRRTPSFDQSRTASETVGTGAGEIR